MYFKFSSLSKVYIRFTIILIGLMSIASCRYSVDYQSQIYLDSISKYSLIGNKNLDEARAARNNSPEYYRLKFNAFSNFVCADSFILLNLDLAYAETRKKYQGTNSIDTMLQKLSDASYNAKNKLKSDKVQLYYFKQKVLK